MNLLRKYHIQNFFKIRTLAFLSIMQLLLISLSKASAPQSNNIGVLEEIPGTRLPKNGFLINYYRFFFIDKKIGWLTARDRMGKTEDGGKTWQIKSLGLLGEPTHALFFLNKDIGWYADFDRVLRTLDGGKNWESITHYPSIAKDPTLYQYVFDDLYFFNEKKGWGISAAELYQTEDGGLTWTKRYEIPGSGGFLKNISFVDPLHGWVGGTEVGPSAFILSTKDGGKTWERIDLGRGAIQYLTFLDSKIGWAIGYIRKSKDQPKNEGFEIIILRTTDGGKSWAQSQVPPEAKDIPFGGSFSTHLYMKDKQEGWAVARHLLLHTKDGGATWQMIASKPDERFFYVTLVEQDGKPTLLVAAKTAIYRMFLE